MPEGDTIYRTARVLGRALKDKKITRFASEYALLAAADDEAPFAGQTVTEVESRGKWLLIWFSGGQILATHMLMSGSWHIYRHGESWQDRPQNARIILETEDFVAVGFRVPVARLHTRQTLARDKKIPKTDRDVLAADFDAKAALERLMSHPKDEVADALLRQEVLAGVGNVFKSEILFANKISPYRRVGELTPKQAKALVATAQKMLAANVLEDSGDRMVTYSGRHRRTTGKADPGQSLWVYGRKDEPCRKCKTPIKRAVQGPNARSTYWCPSCQPLLEREA